MWRFCNEWISSTHKITIFAESKLEFIQSWKTIINTKPKMIYPGHGKPFEYSKLEQNLIYVNKINLYPLHNSKDIHRFCRKYKVNLFD